MFFLTTQPRSDVEIQLTDFDPTAENIEVYKQAFVKEYIKARNEIVSNAVAMQKKWGNDTDGTVRQWSTPAVYADFMKTAMWTAYMNDMPDFEFNCPVEFTRIAPRTQNSYAVSFRYFCTKSGRQDDKKDSTIVLKKDYTIAIGLELENAIKWTDRLQNPLGIRVSEYRVESGGGDPLDFR